MIGKIPTWWENSDRGNRKTAGKNSALVGNFPQWEKKSLPLHGSFSTAAPVLYAGNYLPHFFQCILASGSLAVILCWTLLLVPAFFPTNWDVPAIYSSMKIGNIIWSIPRQKKSSFRPILPSLLFLKICPLSNLFITICCIWSVCFEISRQ